VPSDIEETPVDDTEPNPILEVKVVNKPEVKKSWNDSYEDPEYDEHIITDEEIKEHGNTSS